MNDSSNNLLNMEDLATLDSTVFPLEARQDLVREGPHGSILLTERGVRFYTAAFRRAGIAVNWTAIRTRSDLHAMVMAASAALCAEAVGAMEALNAATFDYLKTRQQFGRPIGSFQALQHRAVDMMIHCEQSRSMAYLASVKVQSEDPNERKRTVSAAKIQIGRSGRVISQEAIQLHGGMGVSNELAAGHYAKRLTMINATLGDVEHHAERFASAG